MTDPAPARRRVSRWLYAIPIIGALLVMGFLATALAVTSCGGIQAHIEPPAPPPPREIAQTP